MSRRARPTLKLSLLSYAIAFAASGGAAQSALAVDLCAGQSAIMVTTANEGDSCSLDTVNAKLTVSESGAIDQGVYGMASGAAVSNAGTISGLSGASDTATGSSANASASAAALYFSGDLQGSLNNTGTISAGADASASAYGSSSASSYYPGYADADANANGIDIDGSALVSISNSGLISASASAYAYGDDGESADARATALRISGSLVANISNTDSIEAYADASSGYAQATGLQIGELTGAVSNIGTIEVDADVSSSGYAQAAGLQIGELTGTVSNSGVIEVDADVSSSGYAQAAGLQVDALAGAFSNSGSIDVDADVFSSGYAQAVGLQVGELTGTVSNSGSIDVDAEVSSSGYAQASGLAFGNVSGSIVNSGEISAFADGNAAISLALSIDGDFSGKVSNTGDLLAVAYGDNNAVAVAAQLGYGTTSGPVLLLAEADTALVGSFANSGNITASSSAYYASAMTLHVGEDFGGAITNTNVMSAFANGYEADAVGVSIDGTLSGAGKITNAGSISALADGSRAAAYAVDIGYGMGDEARLVNSGTLSAVALGNYNDAFARAISVNNDVDGEAVVLNTGSVTATAKGFSYASASGISVDGLYGSALLQNSGTITATAQSYDSFASANGIVASSLGDVARLLNAGNITARATGSDASAYGIGADELYGEAQLVNSGTILAAATANGSETSASAYGISTGSLYDEALLANSGTIVALADGEAGADAFGIEADSLDDSSALVNSGSIKARASVEESGYAEAYGISTGSLEDGAALINKGVVAAVALATEGTGYAEAYGIATGSLYGNSNLTNSGTIRATATAGAYGADASGIVTDEVLGAATLGNRGLIEVVANGGTSASATGIYVNQIQGEGSVLNSGTIRASATAEDAYAYALAADTVGEDARLENTGVIRATATGIDEASVTGISVWSSLSGNASVSNSGSVLVSASASGMGSEVDASGIYVSYMNDTSGIDNSNLIVASARDESLIGETAAAYGIYVSSADGSSIISNSGTIVADAQSNNGDARAYGIYVSNIQSAGVAIENNGTIRVNSNGDSGEAFGIYVSYASATDVMVNNNGLIDGGVYLNGNQISLTNSGVINTHAGSYSYVDGSYTQGAGGSLGFVVHSADSYGSMSVGNADFSASNQIRVLVSADQQLQDGDYLQDVVYSNDGFMLPASGKFTITDSSQFWSFTQHVGSNDLDLEVKFDGAAAAVAGSGLNLSSSLGSLVESVVLGGTNGAYAELAAALNTAPSAAAVANILEQMGPALTGAAGQASRIAGAGASNAIAARQGETRGAASGDAFQHNTLWIKPFLGMAEQDAANGVGGYDVDTTGFVIGIDGDITDSMRVGVAVASAQSDVDGGVAGVDVDTTQFTLYGSYALGGATTLDADISYGANGFDSTRRLGFAGSTAVANYDGTQLALGVSLGHRFALAEKAALIPSLTLRYSQIEIDGYTETGAGAFNLNVADTDEDAVLAVAKATYELGLGSKGVFLASLGAGYDSVDTASATSSLSGTGATFVSNGIEPESTLVTGGLGYRYMTAKNMEINAAYDLESRSDFLGQTVSVKFKLPF